MFLTQRRRATVLTSELEVFIFEEAVHEDGGANRIGFGALALGAGEVADASGFDDGHGGGGGVAGAHHGLFVTAGDFANNLRLGIRAQKFEELGVTFGVVGQEVETAVEMKLQGGLGTSRPAYRMMWLF
jgi:hypothetical protein